MRVAACNPQLLPLLSRSCAAIKISACRSPLTPDVCQCMRNRRQDFGQGAKSVVNAVVQLVSEEGGGVGGEQAREGPGSRLPAATGGSFDSQPSGGNGRGGAQSGGASSKPSGGGGGGGGGGGAGCRVTVGNIPRGQANPEDLAEIFSAAGRVASATVRVTKSKQFEGTVTMESAAAAGMAVELLNGADCNGRALRVRLS